MRKSLGRLAVALGVIVAIAGPLAETALAVPVTPATARTGKLVQVGPIAEDGFPAWYRDSNNVRLEQCISTDDPLCPVLLDSVPNPDLPISWPDNFPDEFFYQLAGADFNLTDGTRVTVGMDLEGAFANGAPADGDQMVFGRVRIRFDAPAGQRYRITHPYGIDDIVADDKKGVNMTEDIGATALAFGQALNSRIGPFLKWDPTVAPAAPAGYVGDPGVNHQVVGSPYNTNFVRIEQLDPTTGAVIGQVGFTDLFSIQGRFATNSGVDLNQANYTLNADGTGTVDVFASSDAAQSIQVVGDPAFGYATTNLRGDGSGRYYGRFPITSGQVADGAKVEVVNAGDKPVAHKLKAVSDIVWVNSVTYNASARTLQVQATSSDQKNNPALSVTGFGPITSAPFSNVAAPPPTITVTSARGGSMTVPVVGAGGSFLPTAPIAAATADNQPIVGQTVKLDASGSTGDITSYAWTQTAGPAVTLTGANTVNASFVPTTAGTYQFSLVVSGPGGTSTPATVSVVVTAPAAATANAGPDQTVVRGRTVTLDGTASRGETYSWRQVSGPAVTLTGATTAKPTFTYPLQALPASPGPNPGFVYDNSPVVLELTVKNPVSTIGVTDQVVIRPQAETLNTGLAVRFRTGSGEWRIAGTSSLVAGQRIEAVVGNTLTGRVIGNAQADAAGAFSIRLNAAGPPAGTTTVSLVSTTGGVTLAFPINITN